MRFVSSSRALEIVVPVVYSTKIINIEKTIHLYGHDFLDILTGAFYANYLLK